MHPVKIGGTALILFGLLFLLLGSWLAYGEVSTANDWVPATGAVKASRVVEFEDKNDRDGLPTILYRAKISYTYDYSGTQHIGNCCSYSSNHRQEAANLVSQYPPGSAIDIFVNSKKPEFSRASWEKGSPLMIFVVLMAIGVICILGGRHLLKSKDDEWVPANPPGMPPLENRPPMME